MAIVFYKFNDHLVKFEAQIQPQSIEAQGSSITFDGDFIYVGDSYRCLRVLWVCDKEELKKKERLADAEGIVNIKRMYANKMNAKMLGVYTLRAAPKYDDYSRLNPSD